MTPEAFMRLKFTTYPTRKECDELRSLRFSLSLLKRLEDRRRRSEHPADDAENEQT